MIIPTTAGQLGAAHIGKRVRVTTKTGVDITDHLTDVRHWAHPAGDATLARVWVGFRNVRPGGLAVLSSVEGAGGFDLDVDGLVEVHD